MCRHDISCFYIETYVLSADNTADFKVEFELQLSAHKVRESAGGGVELVGWRANSVAMRVSMLVPAVERKRQ